VRLVLDVSGRPTVDRGQAAQARGGYLCGPGCLKAAVKRKAFGRAWRGKAAAGTQEAAQLWAELGGGEGEWR
jgi:predicted RNA-binding protein YlxR (DUF448 family)